MTEEKSPGLRLKSWRLVNFKSVRKASIDFRPLTLLVGANSSGKSSVLQSILLVVQSVQSGAANGEFGLNGQLVNLGTHADVHNARASGRTGFGASLELPLSLPRDVAVTAPSPFKDLLLTDWPLEDEAKAPVSLQEKYPLPPTDAPHGVASLSWDATIALAGGKASGAALVRSVHIDVAAGAAAAPHRHVLRLTKSPAAATQVTLWPESGSYDPRPGAETGLLPAYSGVARRVRPKARSQRLGAAKFAGVLPVFCAAGESAVGSAVRHWIRYVRGGQVNKATISPDVLAATPWPAPAARDASAEVVRGLAETLEEYRAASADQVEWFWRLVDTVWIFRGPSFEDPAPFAAAAAHDPFVELVLGLGFRSWVEFQEGYNNQYDWDYPAASSDSSAGEGARQPTEPWKYEFANQAERDWYSFGSAVWDVLLKETDALCDSVAARFPDAGTACVESGPDASFLARASSTAAKFFERDVYYLGPLREEPHPINRRSLVPGSSALGTRGEYMAAVLLDHADQVIDAPWPVEGETGRQSATLKDAVQAWLRFFDIAAEIQLEETSLGPVLQVRERPNGKWLHLTQVGVGVSQLLPVIVLCLMAGEGSVVMLEQPELHLHPKLQQQLGDFLLACALAGRQLIVETHSEYIVSRLRRRIAAAPDDSLVSAVEIIFAEKNFRGDTHFRTVRTNEYGGIEEWPKDFFDQSTSEAQEILRAAVKKRRAEADWKTEKGEGRGGS
jgi:predicted ATPase